MRWIKTLTAVVATLGLNVVSQAGILDLVSHEGGQCGEQACVEKAPECKPTIQRPCETKLFNYQRQVCEKAPPSCKPECVAPAPSAACAPAAKPCAPKAKPCVPPPCPKKKACGKKDGCGDGCVDRCCDADPCEIAELIFQSQTACYAKDRRKAIDKLGDKFDCVCNPEIMAAFIYAL
ncbi:MAG: hypothetical protein GXP27_02210, partial [Planctomycetes bacterium]|nr:hypothetical protein [Planctomycetota bacterium]